MRQTQENGILKLFYEYPNRSFTVRELEKTTKIPRATAHRILIALKKEELITKDNKAETNILFKTKKTNYYIEEIIKSGLVRELTKILNPSCIILFGSIRRGDSVKESDIDLFVESPVKKDFSIKKYEKILGHKIQLFIETDIHNLQPTLFNNIINGVILYGGLRLR